MKDEILATVSHELRTPLSAMLLWSQLLENGSIQTDEKAQTYRSIRESAQAQQQLIEDLLDISRMLAGEMRINLHAADLKPIIRAATTIVRPLAVARNIRIDEELDLDVSVQADAGRIQQVVLNLLNNAVKFSHDGGHVHVRLRRANGAAEIEVTDGGQGISAELLPYVFERFRQAQGGTPRHGGLGLGLAIARELVELHGGDIRAKSPGAGLGATFTVQLPTEQKSKTSSDPASMQPSMPPAQAQWRFVPTDILLGVRALVVEDDPTTREAIQYLLEKCQAEVIGFDSAADALAEFAASLGTGPRFDVLLSDIALPQMNGHDLIRKIREIEQHANALRPIPAVALTAYAREQDRVAALAAGFNVHLTKPVVATLMVRTVANCVGRPMDEGPSGRGRNPSA
ncbi:MAG TPA: hybrid sensor histidine kinase/response regulator [Humisphaera sp.]|nr:hybrid sensor histidine kinase/response regulator [Humisphaera sp.]